MAKSNMIKNRLSVLEVLKKFTANREVVSDWVWKKPQQVVEIIKTADHNVREVVMADIIRPASREYLLAVCSVSTLANILSTDGGLRFMLRILPTYNLYDLFIWSLHYLTSRRSIELKVEILRCIRFITSYAEAANYFRSNHDLYKILKFCLTPDNSNNVIENSLMIVKNLLENIVEPRVSIKVVEEAPILEIKKLSLKFRRKSLKQLAKLVFAEAANIYRNYHTENDQNLRQMIQGTPRILNEISSSSSTAMFDNDQLARSISQNDFITRINRRQAPKRGFYTILTHSPDNEPVMYNRNFRSYENTPAFTNDYKDTEVQIIFSKHSKVRPRTKGNSRKCSSRKKPPSRKRTAEKSEKPKSAPKSRKSQRDRKKGIFLLNKKRV